MTDTTLPDNVVQAAAEVMYRRYQNMYGVNAEHLTWRDFTDDAREIVTAALAADARHVIDLRDDGWTIQHPLACRPNLFDCPVNRVAERYFSTDTGARGRYYCRIDDGVFVIEEPAP